MACAVAFNADNLGNLANTPQEFRELQLKYDNLRPVIRWLEDGDNRPSWQDVSACSGVTKAYWAEPSH
jgi:hypothetical protein